MHYHDIWLIGQILMRLGYDLPQELYPPIIHDFPFNHSPYELQMLATSRLCRSVYAAPSYIISLYTGSFSALILIQFYWSLFPLIFNICSYGMMINFSLLLFNPFFFSHCYVFHFINYLSMVYRMESRFLLRRMPFFFFSFNVWCWCYILSSFSAILVWVQLYYSCVAVGFV